MADTFTLENVTREELKRGLAAGTIRLVDVREPNEYADGHIPGAILNPLQSFDVDALPPRRTASAWCCRAARASARWSRWNAPARGPQRSRRALRRRHARLERAGEPVEE